MVRPEILPNAYVAPLDAEQSIIDVYWSERKQVREIVLFLDTDYDHPMESTLMGHPEDIMPFCVQDYIVKNCGTTLLFTVEGNHQTLNRLVLEEPIETDHLQVILNRAHSNVPISLFEILCFEK